MEKGAASAAGESADEMAAPALEEEEVPVEAGPAAEEGSVQESKPSDTAEVEEPAAEGTQFGQYVLLEHIATGGMAEVYKARMMGMEGFQKTVAIKRILPHLTDNEEFVTMFPWGLSAQKSGAIQSPLNGAAPPEPARAIAVAAK